jgi:hypothetical protein
MLKVGNKLGELSLEELVGFQRECDSKIYLLDEDRIYNFVGGSDDGFLYARYFDLAMGKKYFYSVTISPKKVLSFITVLYVRL